MFEYQIIFIFISILGIIDLLNKDKQIKIVLFSILIIIAFFIIGLSYKIGVDWPNYYDAWNSGTESNSEFEIGYRFISATLSEIGFNYWVFYFIVKLLFLFELAYVSFKSSAKPTLCLGIVIIALFPNYLEQVRQLIAATFLLFVFNHYKQTLKIYQVILISLVHSSGLLIIIGSIINYLNTNSKNIWHAAILTSITLPVILFLDFSFINALFELDKRNEKISYYLDRPLDPNMILTILRITFLIYLVRSKTVSQININLLGNNVARIIKIYTITMLFIEIIFFWIPLIPLRTRLYFFIFAIVLYTNTVSIKKNIYQLTTTLIILTILNLSIWNFSTNRIAINYSLDMNIFIDFMSDFPENNWESNARNYWGSE